MNGLALDGVRIVDFSWQIAGPTCTRYLGAMGADVIRIESGRRPDPYRARTISYFINQSKKSITLNLSHPQGIQLVKDLASISDVVVENFAPGVIERLGLSYEEFRSVRPEIVMLSSAGLGHSGPDMKHVAYGTLVQCFTGWSALQGYPDREPELVSGIWTDPMVGIMEVFLINAAIHNARQTGKGEYIDVSMAEATTMLLPEVILDYGMNQRTSDPLGNRDIHYAPQGNYPCIGQDEWIGISIKDDLQWGSLCTVLACSELEKDLRFDTLEKRRLNHDDLDALLSKYTRDWDATDLMEALQDKGVPAGNTQTVPQLNNNKHWQYRNFFQDYIEEDDDHTTHSLPVVPWRFDGEIEASVTGQPNRGQHNLAIFEDLLGLTEAEVEKLIEQEVIY